MALNSEFFCYKLKAIIAGFHNDNGKMETHATLQVQISQHCLTIQLGPNHVCVIVSHRRDLSLTELNNIPSLGFDMIIVFPPPF